MIRAIFVMTPALICGVAGALLEIEIGLLLFGSIAWLGWECTKPRPDRGEF